MFNDYAWKTYLKAGGSEVAEMFRKNLSENYTSEYADRIKELHSEYCPSKYIVDEMHQQLIDLCEGFGLLVEGEYTVEKALKFIWNQIEIENDGLNDSGIFEVFVQGMAYFSTCLSAELSDLFVPYYFTYNFNVLERIAEEFEINLPKIPAKKDYEKRFYYYGEICAALSEFRELHNLTPYELFAFLYDYAPKYVGGLNYIMNDLPEPKGAFFIGGSKNDIFLDESNPICAWQCNPETKAGDMIVMYLRTPISSVDSVWRSVSVGFNDPFFYYYRCTYIGKRTIINRITQKQLQADEILGQMPIVKKNMQGINRVELKPSEYNHLVELAGADVPKLEYVFEPDAAEFTNEKDVENKLIKPLLKKLGYDESEYEQQLRIETGNHNATEIPDFVLLPKKSSGVQTAFAIIEAKRSIKNAKEFEEVKSQARSYARQLSARHSVIADKDKLWIFHSGDLFVEEVFSAVWADLGNANSFSVLHKLIGRDKPGKMSYDETRRRLSGRAAKFFMFEDD